MRIPAARGIAFVAALALVCGAARAAAGEALTVAPGSILALETLAEAGGSAAIAGVSKPVLQVPETGPSFRVPVSEEGRIELSAAHVPELAPEALGLRIAYSFAAPALLADSKRVAYQFVPAAELAAAFPLRLSPLGLRTAEAEVRVRQVLPVHQRLMTPPITLPAGARLDFALGLQQDWRAQRGAGAVFTVALAWEERWQRLHQEALFYEDDLLDGPRWRERSVDLSAFSGETARLVFITAPVDGGPETQFAHPLWGAPALHAVPAAGERPAGAPPNIIFICLDTVRADRLGVYGYARETSPRLDAFAGEAAVFEQAIAPAPWTTPVFASLFTGFHPEAHRAGVLSAGYHLGDEWPRLAEHLAIAGYRTAAFTEGVALRGEMGFARGFHHYSDGPAPDRHRMFLAPETFASALAWVDAHAHTPFFLFVQTYEPHAPYGAPPEYEARFARPEFAGASNLTGEEAETPEERRHVQDLYDAGLAYTDACLGEFLDALAERGLIEHSLVAIFSDHGEAFWEHGALGHTRTVHDTTLHVPLVVRMPGTDPPALRIAEQVSLTDLFATALEFAGGAAPPDADAYSLLPLIRGESGYPRTHVHSVLVNTTPDLVGDGGAPIEWRKDSVRGPERKYIRSNRAAYQERPDPEALDAAAAAAEERLYLMEDDPGEQRDRAGAYPSAVAEYRARHEAFLEAQRRIREERAAAGETSGGLSADDVRALRSLGYL